MRGGYLTLDFSDVEFKEGNIISNFTLGYKKGIKKYVDEVKKPIYLILSDSVYNAIVKFCGVGSDARNKSPILIQSIISQNENSAASTYIFPIYQSYKETLDITYLDVPSLVLIFGDDDIIKITEL